MKRVLVFFGLTGSGKSFLAKQWAETNGFAYFNTDVVRKQLAGIAPDRRCADGLGQGIYSSEFSRKTYDALLDCARSALAGEYPVVILDGSFQLQNERQRVIDTFSKDHQVLFIYCRCSDKVTRQRLDQRLSESDAVSDGRLEVYFAQLKTFEYPQEISAGQLLQLDTDAPLGYLVDRLEHFVSSAPSFDSNRISPRK